MLLRYAPGSADPSVLQHVPAAVVAAGVFKCLTHFSRLINTQLYAELLHAAKGSVLLLLRCTFVSQLKNVRVPQLMNRWRCWRKY